MELKVVGIKLTNFSTWTQSKSRFYVHPQGETLIDNLINRRTRPIKEYRRVVERVLDEKGVDRSMVSIKWSQKAGCGCGCSPGFIVDGWLGTELHRQDVFIDVEGVD